MRQRLQRAFLNAGFLRNQYLYQRLLRTLLRTTRRSSEARSEASSAGSDAGIRIAAGALDALSSQWHSHSRRWPRRVLFLGVKGSGHRHHDGRLRPTDILRGRLPRTLLKSFSKHSRSLYRKILVDPAVKRDGATVALTRRDRHNLALKSATTSGGSTN